VELFERAFGFIAEPDGKPIEEFRVGRLVAHFAEVAGGIYEAGTEVILPDAVGDGAPSEDVVRVGEPVGEGGTTVAFFFGGGESGGEGGETVEGSGAGEGAGGGEAAAIENVDGAGGEGGAEGTDAGEVSGTGVDEFGGGQGGELGVDGGEFLLAFFDGGVGFWADDGIDEGLALGAVGRAAGFEALLFFNVGGSFRGTEMGEEGAGILDAVVEGDEGGVAGEFDAIEEGLEAALDSEFFGEELAALAADGGVFIVGAVGAVAINPRRAIL